MNVLIATADERFARMLSLEFSERGFTPLIASAKSEMPDLLKSAHLALVDAKLLSEGPLPPFSFETVILGYPEELASLPTAELTKYFTITRPFVIEEFFDTFFESDEKSHKIAFHIPKKKSPSEFLSLDKENRIAYFKGKKIELTKKEFSLLDLLYENRGIPVSREEALSLVFGEAGHGTNVVDVYVNYLRAKIDNPFGVRLITTVRGKGYVIEES